MNQHTQELLYLEEPVHKKSLKLEVKKDSVKIETDSTGNDIFMVALIGSIAIALVFMVLRFKMRKVK